MDDNGSPKPADPLAGTLDPAAERKHAAMIDRLSNLHQSRLHDAAARRQSSAVPAFESVAAFLDRFADARRSIDVDLHRCRSLAGTLDPTALKPELDKVAAAVADLDLLVAENSYFLPPYEVRSSLKAISDLKEALEAANSELLPRKKFSFRNKASNKDPSFLVREVEEMKRIDGERSKLGIGRESPGDGNKMIDGGIGRESAGFRNRKGGILVKDFRVSEEGEGDFSLADLSDCEVYLKGRIRAIFMHKVVNCKVFVGPVTGSILIEEVSSSVLMLASHQIRIHEAKATDFYLRVRSRPIIEDGSGVRFAPYMLFYQGIDEDLKVSGLGEETGNWANVDDFKWLRAVQSPNWSLIPGEERLATKDISDVEEQCQDK